MGWKLISLIWRFECFYFMNSVWTTEQQKQRRIYRTWWVRMSCPFVSHNIGSIAFRTVTLNSTIYLALDGPISGYRSFEAAYRRRSSIDYTVFSRATWVLPYCDGNTSARIRQNVEIRTLDTTWVATASAATQSRCLYGINVVLPQLPVAPQSYYWRWEVSVAC